VLVAIALAFVVSLSMRHTFKVDVVRDRMTLARIVDDGQIENLYRLQLMNATEQPQRYRIDVHGIDGAALAGAGAAAIDIQPAQSRWVTLAVRIPPQRAVTIGAGAHPIRFEIAAASNPAAKVSERSTFVVPR